MHSQSCWILSIVEHRGPTHWSKNADKAGGADWLLWVSRSLSALSIYLARRLEGQGAFSVFWWAKKKNWISIFLIITMMPLPKWRELHSVRRPMTYISWTCPYQSLSIMQFNNTQQAALSPIFIALGRRREKLESKYIPCSYECDSLHLGTLLKSTKIHGLSMYLVPPYPGVAIKGAVRCFIGINHLKSSCAVPGRRVSWIK